MTMDYSQLSDFEISTKQWQFAVDLLLVRNRKRLEHQSLVLSGMTKLVMQ